MKWTSQVSMDQFAGLPADDRRTAPRILAAKPIWVWPLTADTNAALPVCLSALDARQAVLTCMANMIGP